MARFFTTPTIDTARIGKGIARTAGGARKGALDVGVFLPLGVFSAARDEVAGFDLKEARRLIGSLVGRGETRMSELGHVAQRGRTRVMRPVWRARNEGLRSVDEARARARLAGQDAEEATDSAKKRVTSATRRAEQKTSAAAASRGPTLSRVGAPRSARDLPITGYASLTADEVADRLGGLSQTDLAMIYKYEKAHDGRVTVLAAVEAKMIDLPIPT
jgi:hypothetical protein